jgi:hypothetical protein
VLTVKHYRDFSYTAVEERSYYAQPPTSPDLPVLDTVVLDSGALWSQERLVPIRVAVAPQNGFSFAWSFETTDDIVFVGWSLGFASAGTPVIAGKVVS